MQYTKETYPDIFHMTCESEKEIIPFRPVVVEQSEENVAPMTGDDKVEMVEDKDEKTDNDLEKRVVSLEMIKGEGSVLGDGKDNCMGYIYDSCLLVCLV